MTLQAVQRCNGAAGRCSTTYVKGWGELYIHFLYKLHVPVLLLQRLPSSNLRPKIPCEELSPSLCSKTPSAYWTGAPTTRTERTILHSPSFLLHPRIVCKLSNARVVPGTGTETNREEEQTATTHLNSLANTPPPSPSASPSFSSASFRDFSLSLSPVPLSFFHIRCSSSLGVARIGCCVGSCETPRVAPLLICLCGFCYCA